MVEGNTGGDQFVLGLVYGYAVKKCDGECVNQEREYLKIGELAGIYVRMDIIRGVSNIKCTGECIPITYKHSVRVVNGYNHCIYI